MTITKTKAFAVPALVLLTLGASSSAFAGRFAATHPRRAEVNDRLAVQNLRIRQQVQNGTMSRAEARDLHAQDRGIRQEERVDASVNGSHITAGEKAGLNAQENAVSREIGR